MKVVSLIEAISCERKSRKHNLKRFVTYTVGKRNILGNKERERDKKNKGK